MKKKKNNKHILCTVITTCKANPIQALWAALGLRLPEFLDNRHIKVARLSASCTGHLYPQETSVVPISVHDYTYHMLYNTTGLHFAHAVYLCVSYNSDNKCIVPKKALSRCSLYHRHSVFWEAGDAYYVEKLRVQRV